MEKNVINVNQSELEVVNGKVVINSEELANAIQNEELGFEGEEEDSFGSDCSIIKIVRN